VAKKKTPQLLEIQNTTRLVCSGLHLTAHIFDRELLFLTAKSS